MVNLKNVSIGEDGSFSGEGAAAVLDTVAPWKIRASTQEEVTAALLAAKAAKTAPKPGLISDWQGRVEIELPAGDITITELYGLLGTEAMDTKINSLRIKGAGRTLTQVIFDPTDPAAEALMFNDFWLDIYMEGISFITLKTGATFMRSYTTHNAQNYTFVNCAWVGPWKYGIDLQGNNNNSEYLFLGCSTSKMADDGAFLYIGATNTSDQFLNYWFYGFKHWSTGCPLIDAALGGHFHLYGVDVSDWGNNLTSTQYVIALRGNVHAYGVQSMTASGLRVEAKNALCALLYSEWSDGNIEIQVDWQSQSPGYTYGDIIHLNVGNTAGAVVNIHDSALSGGVKVTYLINAWQFQQKIIFNNCTWTQRRSPSEVVTYDESGAGSNAIRPNVHFVNCRGREYQNSGHANGASVWDATIGHSRGSMVKPLQKRAITIRGPRGNITETGTPKVNFPVGAWITGIRVISPATTVSDADGATWRIFTTETTPVQIASVTVATALQQGYNVATELPVPYHCSTLEKATIVAGCTGTTTEARDALLIVEGYW